MSFPAVMLGSVAFADFEVPESIRFGGAQKLAVHRLPGGARVIDAMGRDDADLTWSGFFSGASAADRARMVDQMRAEGGQLTLIWDAFCYDVIIRRFEVDYRNPFWLPYRIICTVVWDEAQANADLVLPLSTSILGDLAVAAGYGIDVTQAQSALSMANAMSNGSSAFAAANSSLAAMSQNIDQVIESSGSEVGTLNPASDVSPLATLASFSMARGHAARAARNLSDASS